MLIENTLFGDWNVEQSISLIRENEPPEGYRVAFSGGKDSIVLLDLIRRAGVRYEAHTSLTGLEPPELVQFIEENYGGSVTIHRPPMDAFALIRRHLFPFTRRYRPNYSLRRSKVSAFDTRKPPRRQESAARRTRQLREVRFGDEFLNPLLYWSEKDIWQYIRNHNLPYCHLYDEGFRRLGCVLCPYQSKAERELHLQRYPEIAAKFKETFDWIVAERRRRGKPFKNFETGEDLWHWWIAR